MFEDLPDSVISEAVLPDLITQGAQLTKLSGQIFLDYEIKNIGQALASRNFTRFYYSSDAVLDNSDFDVGNNSVNPLNKNESFQGQVGLNISPNASQKYLLIQTDISNLITESDELNNIQAVGLDLSSTTSLSDLTISGLSVSNKTNQVTQGYGFIPTYTLKNQGNAVAGTSVTKYVISKDAVLGNADDFIPVSLANGGAVAGLAAGASRVENNDYLVIYDNITSGLYNLFAIVDSTNTVAENNENNNVLSISINFSSPDKPDLRIEKFTSPNSADVGSYLNIAYTIRNIDKGYTGYSHISFYLSQNTVIDSSDLSLDYHLISSDTPSNIPISRNRSIWLDQSKINAGTYNLIAKVDPNNGISESNEANNTFINKITLNSLLLPNLSVSLNSLKTIQTGSLTTIPYTVFNTGGATKESQISLYLSTDSALDSTDKLIHSQNVQALRKKSSVKGDASVYFDPNLAALGTNSYYLIAMIDSATNGIAESNETNNIKIYPVTIVNSGTTQFTNNKGYGFINAAAAVASAIGQAPFADVPNSNTINWGVDLIKAPEVWAKGFTGQGITVAVIDTGVDYNHPDLKDNIWVNVDEIAGNSIDDDKNGFIRPPAKVLVDHSTTR